jgi:hypothetical protein
VEDFSANIEKEERFNVRMVRIWWNWCLDYSHWTV